MKKIFPVIIGVFVGVIASFTMIRAGNEHITYGSANTPFDFDIFDWNTVFGSLSKGQEMYNLIYNSILVVPKNDALKAVAGNYGLTEYEADQVVNGSIAPLYNNPDRNSTVFTQEQAVAMAAAIQTDYADFKELFDLEQQLNSILAPSEIFANGDVMDSGFDLIYDLSIMEQILFGEDTDITIGGTFLGGPDSPVLPTDEDNSDLNITREDSLDTTTEEDGGEEDKISRTGGGVADTETAATDNPADDTPPTLDKDVCVVESSEDAGSDDDGNPDGNEADTGADTAVGIGAETGAGTGTGGATGGEIPSPSDTDDQEYALLDEDGRVQSPQPNDWTKSWCPGLADPDVEASAGSVAAAAGIRSPGGVGDAILGGELSAGAGAGLTGPGFSAAATICLTTELVWKTVTSYYPGESCILCEIEQINEFFNKTLSHSLLPNKVTGNLFESAKCKQSFQEPLLDMKIIAMAAPISTPLNDDAIFGKSIVEEWNKFIERYQPLLLPSIENYTTFELNNVDEYTTQSEIYNNIQQDLSKERAKAETDIANYSSGNITGNTMTYGQDVLLEMKQMTVFFKSIEERFNDMQKACQQIQSKPDID